MPLDRKDEWPADRREDLTGIGIELQHVTGNEPEHSPSPAHDPPFCSAAPFVISPDGCVQIRPIWRLFGRAGKLAHAE